jgi:DNA-binding MarR family transcriptional regulator
MERSVPPYIRLLNLMRAIRELSPFNSLTTEEEALLEDLLLHWHEKGVAPMNELLASELYKSRSSVYRRILGLRDKGMVVLESDPGDKRIKWIKPSDSAELYIERFRTGLDEFISSGKGA